VRREAWFTFGIASGSDFSPPGPSRTKPRRGPAVRLAHRFPFVGAWAAVVDSGQVGIYALYLKPVRFVK
jgi:hypothetical protein